MKSIELKRKKLEYTLQFIWCINLIIITNIIGRVGMEYFGYAYEVYLLFYIVTIGSFPLAIYKLFKMRQQKEKFSESRKVMKVSGILAAFYAIFGSLFLYIISEMFLSGFCRNPFAGIILKLLIPFYVLQCILQVMTGYFQVKGSLAATVLVRITEAVVSLISCIFIALSLRQYGSKVSALLLDDNYTSAYGALGFPASLICGSLIAVFLFGLIILLNKRNRKEPKSSVKSEDSFFYLLKLLIRTMSPYMGIAFLMRAIVLISFLLDNTKLITSDKMVSDYGLLYGIFLPFTGAMVLLFAIISLGKVNIITISIKKQEIKHAKECFQTWIHLLFIIAGFISVIVFGLANSISGLLFKSASAELGNMLRFGGISILFAAFGLFFLDLLRTTKKFQKIYLSLGVGLLVFIVVLVAVSKVSSLDTMAFIYAWDAFWGIIALLNGYFATQSLKTAIRMKDLLLIPLFTLFIIGFAMIQLEKLLLYMLGDALCIIVCVAIAVIVMICVLVFTHNLEKEELEELPLGKYLLMIASKLHLLS